MPRRTFAKARIAKPAEPFANPRSFSELPQIHAGYNYEMKLQQSQIWKVGEEFYRVVRVERLAVEYKAMPAANTKKGTHHRVTKKEFCRLIKSATLLTEREIFLAPPE